MRKQNVIDLKIAFVSKETNRLMGSYRIPFFVYRDALIKLGVQVTDTVDDSVAAAITPAGHGMVEGLKSYKNLIVVVSKPHYEINFPACPILSVQNFRNLVNLVRPNYLNKGFKAHEIDIKKADILIADTRRLQRYFSINGFESVYMRLIDESYWKREKLLRSLPRPGESLNIVYHGNASLINLKLEEIVELLSPYLEQYRVKFFIITESRLFYTKSKVKNIDIIVTNFSPERLISLMQSAHIGIAPDLFLKSKGKINSALGYLFFKRYQDNLDIVGSKLSSNAGRLYVFADFLVPFLSSSSEEALLDFPNYLAKHGGSLDFSENKDLLAELLTPEGYRNAQLHLIKDRDRIDPMVEARKLVAKIQAKRAIFSASGD
jgi:hypothetical protein